MKVGLDAVVDDELELADGLLVLAQQDGDQLVHLGVEPIGGDDAIPQPQVGRSVGGVQGTEQVDLFGRPMSRVMRVVPPQPGVMPTSTSGIPHRADAAATTKSHAIVISSPPPTACPSTAAMLILSSSSNTLAMCW